MLLSKWGINLEPEDIVANSPIPFLLEYDEDNDCFLAGMLVQRNEVFNAISIPYGLSHVDWRGKDWDEYRYMAIKLLQNGIPFMTGIAAKAIPLSSYDHHLREKRNSLHGHAVVISEYDGEYFHGFDPSGGLDRSRRYSFDEVKNRISFRLDPGQFRSGLELKQGKSFHIGYQQSEISPVLPYMIPIYERSKAALSIFSEKMRTLITSLTDEPSNIEICRIMIDYIKPIVLDLRIALEIHYEHNNNESNLCASLGMLRDLVLFLRTAIRNQQNIDTRKINELSGVIHDVISELHRHFRSTMKGQQY